MERFKEIAGQVGGAIVGLFFAVLMIGGFFASCILPFINDSSETWTCADAEVSEFCSDPETIGGFLADLKQRGKMIGANDLFIAAHARALGLTLITNNTQEFSRVAGLALENWAA